MVKYTIGVIEEGIWGRGEQIKPTLQRKSSTVLLVNIVFCHGK